MLKNNKAKKIIFAAIIISAYILSIIISMIAEQMYLNADPNSVFDVYQTYITLDYLIAFLLSTPFYIILIVFFRQYRDLTIFSSLALAASLSFVLYNVFIFSVEPESAILTIFNLILILSAVTNVFIAFKIILQEKYEVYINNSFLIFAAINYGFFSFYTPFLKWFIELFVGPYPHFLRNTFMFYDLLYLFLQLIMVITQVLIIWSFIDNKVYNRKRIY